MSKYSKALAAIGGGAVTLITVLGSASKWIQAISPVLTVLSVYAAPKNK